MEISSIIIRIAFGAFFVIIFDHHDSANVNTGIFVSTSGLPDCPRYRNEFVILAQYSY
jgi:hypothetical protein